MKTKIIAIDVHGDLSHTDLYFNYGKDGCKKVELPELVRLIEVEEGIYVLVTKGF